VGDFLSEVDTMLLNLKKRVRSGDDSILDESDHLQNVADLPHLINESPESRLNIDDTPSHALLPADIFNNGYLGEVTTLPPPPGKVKAERRPKTYEFAVPNVNYNLISDRLIGTLHMPLQIPKMGLDKKDTRTKCGICSAKTTIKCSHCGVGMCIADRDGKNCWREFHTREVLEYAPPKAQTHDKNDRSQKYTDRNHD
jgi:hypothetical protein